MIYITLFIIILLLTYVLVAGRMTNNNHKLNNVEIGKIEATDDNSAQVKENAELSKDGSADSDESGGESKPKSYIPELPQLPPHLQSDSPMDNYHLRNQWSTNQGYTQCYPPVSWDNNNCNIYQSMDIDEKNSQHWRMANRDKEMIDGWASKNADYYRKNYYNELEKEESKVWWGRNEW